MVSRDSFEHNGALEPVEIRVEEDKPDLSGKTSPDRESH